MTSKSSLKISSERLQLIMARKCFNPYDLCSRAEIAYPTYQRMVKMGSCKIATLGKVARALGVDVTEILED